MVRYTVPKRSGPVVPNLRFGTTGSLGISHFSWISWNRLNSSSDHRSPSRLDSVEGVLPQSPSLSPRFLGKGWPVFTVTPIFNSVQELWECIIVHLDVQKTKCILLEMLYFRVAARDHIIISHPAILACLRIDESSNFWYSSLLLHGCSTCQISTLLLSAHTQNKKTNKLKRPG